MKVETKSIDEIKPYENNPRDNDDAVDTVANSIKEFGWQQPIVVDNEGVIIAGHTRYKAAKKLGMDKVPVVVASSLTPEQVKAYRLADNKVGELADWDYIKLDEELDGIDDIDMTAFGFDLENGGVELDDDFSSDDEEKDSGALARDFMIPPFSVIDTKNKAWQDRKKKWLNLGIKSELGRKDGLTFAESINVKGLPATSVFDPVLTEIIYKWFTPHKHSKVFDPFAGGSVRGIVASMLGNSYIGIDLSQKQIKADYENAKEVGADMSLINWHVDDSKNIDKYIDDGTQDLMIACPPYLDLEVYSDDPNDLSNMSDEQFESIYSEILKKSCNKLRDNRFAVIVVSDVRGKGKNTGYRDLTGMTKRAMAQGGCCFYDDIVLLNAIGSAAMRARRYMNSRKVARVHQNVLVFYKGDTSKIKDEFEPIDGLDDALKEVEESSDSLSID